jgi:hypothetical protein
MCPGGGGALRKKKDKKERKKGRKEGRKAYHFLFMHANRIQMYKNKQTPHKIIKC